VIECELRNAFFRRFANISQNCINNVPKKEKKNISKIERNKTENLRKSNSSFEHEDQILYFEYLFKSKNIFHFKCDQNSLWKETFSKKQNLSNKN
jgi:hypothetical protein